MTEPQTAAPAPAQPSGDVPLGMEDQVLLSRKPLEVLHKLMTGEENQMPPRSVIDALMRNYAAAAAAGKVVQSGDFYTFETGFADQNGVPINASIKRADYGTFPWYLSYIGNHAGKADAPGKRLEQFAFLGSWQSFLRDLAAIALPEPWDFENRGDYREHHILQKYIQYTFYRLTQEGGKILTSDDERFAAFNTGLVTPHYDDIYACFEASSDEYDTKWRFLEFCTKGRRGTGKRLVETFNPLPQPARYFERREDLLFDLDKDLHPITITSFWTTYPVFRWSSCARSVTAVRRRSSASSGSTAARTNAARIPTCPTSSPISRACSTAFATAFPMRSNSQKSRFAGISRRRCRAISPRATS